MQMFHRRCRRRRRFFVLVVVLLLLLLLLVLVVVAVAVGAPCVHYVLPLSFNQARKLTCISATRSTPTIMLCII